MRRILNHIMAFIEGTIVCSSCSLRYATVNTDGRCNVCISRELMREKRMMLKDETRREP